MAGFNEKNMLDNSEEKELVKQHEIKKCKILQNAELKQ